MHARPHAGDDEGGTLELAEVVEKTKTMTMTGQAATSSLSSASQERRRRPLAVADAAAAAAASVETKEEDAEEAADSDSKVPVSLVAQIRSRKKKLLVLDLNGLLADINRDFHNARLSHGRCRGKLGKVVLCIHLLSICLLAQIKLNPTQIANSLQLKYIRYMHDLYLVLRTYVLAGVPAVFKRPFCDDFLRFCFHNFDVGVWSSRQRC